jgi:subtilase family serine protease
VPQGGTADCTATCYTPQQLEAAYGVRPLLQRGIDGRGETVALPELAESPGSPEVSDLRQDFYAKRHLGFVNPAVYQIARGSQYQQAFHDVTTGPANTAEFPHGTITGYQAGPGWDPVTGWGTANAEVLVSLLASHSSR